MENFIDIPNIKAVVLANLPGTESGNAIVDVLFGDVDPSGRLPYTIGKKENDYGPGSKVKYLPSPSDGLAPQQNFSEGLYIDYRHFDKQNITPRYEFGYGLSYANFELASLVITEKGKKTPLPAPRPQGLAPPSYSTDLPDPKSALFPEGFHKVERYIYPWLESIEGIKKPTMTTSQPQSPLSDAGGGPGGNPDLYTTLITVGAQLSSAGITNGSTVVQLYVSFPQNYTDHETGESVDFPVRVLRGFEKIHHYEAQESSTSDGKHGYSVSFDVTRRDLSYWDVKRQNWVLPNGEFGIAVGFSSRNLPLTGKW